VLERQRDVAEHDEPRVAQAAATADRLDGALAAVGRRAAAGRHEDLARARGGRRDDELAGSARRRPPGIALVLGDEPEAGRLRDLDDRRVARAADVAGDRPPERIGRGGRLEASVQRFDEQLERALAAVGDRAAVGLPAGVPDASHERVGDRPSVERALERVGRDEGPRHHAARGRGERIAGTVAAAGRHAQSCGA
jgi:hypothetical protein